MQPRLGIGRREWRWHRRLFRDLRHACPRIRTALFLKFYDARTGGGFPAGPAPLRSRRRVPRRSSSAADGHPRRTRSASSGQRRPSRRAKKEPAHRSTVRTPQAAEATGKKRQRSVARASAAGEGESASSRTPSSERAPESVGPVACGLLAILAALCPPVTARRRRMRRSTPT